MTSIKKAEAQFRRLERKEAVILQKHGGDVLDAYDDLEPVYIGMENVHTEVGDAYGPFLQCLATVHILSAAALEAHINAKAQELSGRVRDCFERFPLDAKWLLPPRLVGLSGFEPERMPFKGLMSLVRFRNALVHYKRRTEEWQLGRVPECLANLGLTPEAGRGSVKAVEAMVRSLSRQLKTAAPDWLSWRGPGYFTLETEGAGRRGPRRAGGASLL
jgi:hypothetical protein